MSTACISFKKSIVEPFRTIETKQIAKYALILGIVSLALGLLHCSNCFISHPEYQSILSFSAIEQNFFIGYMSVAGGLSIVALFLKVVAVWKNQVHFPLMEDYSSSLILQN